MSYGCYSECIYEGIHNWWLRYIKKKIQCDNHTLDIACGVNVI